VSTGNENIEQSKLANQALETEDKIVEEQKTIDGIEADMKALNQTRDKMDQMIESNLTSLKSNVGTVSVVWQSTKTDAESVLYWLNGGNKVIVSVPLTVEDII
jgi:hypothetical protein